MCGKNQNSFLKLSETPGSPPRVREKLKVNSPNVKATGITPACAGKTRLNHTRQSKGWDHPRVCGKNLLPRLFLTEKSGSPPRVREKLGSRLSIHILLRITPACAGKTWVQIPHSPLSKDHPRVCGKNSPQNFEIFDKSGSPPRVREKRV